MTRSEAAFQRRVRQLGCIACRVAFGVQADAEIHHILNGSRKIGEMDVLGLCPSHHRLGLDNEIVTSRHPHKIRFVARYGSEAELLAKTRELLA